MGNVCCGTTEERSKPSAFTTSGDSVASNSVDASTTAKRLGSSSATQPTQQTTSDASNLINNNSNAATTGQNRQESPEVDKERREEESRLELLVQTAGRAMVAVRSTRGSNPYYDQGFAAALAQHLEQTTKFPTQVPPLPKTPSNSSVYDRLSQNTWHDLELGHKGGLAGCAGENPEKYLDRVAESFLDRVVPKKEQLFSKSKPIVESLL